MISTKINEIKNRKTLEKIFETKSWFSEKSNKMDKSLSRPTERERSRVRGREKTDYQNHEGKGALTLALEKLKELWVNTVKIFMPTN